MKGKDIILLGGLAIGGFLLYKMFSGGNNTISGGGGAMDTTPINWDFTGLESFLAGFNNLNIPPPTNNNDGTNNTTQTAPKDVYMIDYGSTPAPLSKKIVVPATTWRYNKNVVVPYIPKDWTPSFKVAIRKLFPPAIITR